MRAEESNGPPKVIGVTGMPGSGKGEFCEIAVEMGITVRSLGDVVRKFFSGEHPGENMKEIGNYANRERDIHGKDVWASRLVKEVRTLLEKEDELILIDGVRSPYELEIFRDEWGDRFSILCVHSSPSTRFKRLRGRGRGDDPADRSSFDERDRRELSWGLGDVIARADIMLVNEGDMKGFRSESKMLLEELQ